MDATGSYDVIVIGGGHAGAEAAWAAANALRATGGRVALLTMDPDRTGQMSCNPAIGGLAKGQMVREIDALGGLMGRAIDATGLQFRLLNASKGPAVQGPRAQADKHRYAAEVRRLLETRDNLEIVTARVEDFLRAGEAVVGVTATDARGAALELRAAAVVLTTGTFMRGLMHTGETRTPGGRVREAPATGVSGALERAGFELGRLKTGTPPRLDGTTIELHRLEAQPGDATPLPFAPLSRPGPFPAIEQHGCAITHTNPAIHRLIEANLDRAPMYNGQVDTAGPRYCPSIEDKVVRFADRESHHVFLEPEGIDDTTIYCNGISTSLPEDVQRAIVARLPGCERAAITQLGYAVEYDMVMPHQIDATTMTKRAPGLFLAGQINGTTGYEEAAGQGLVAGVNAARRAAGRAPVRLGRERAYIGVLLDDLVTKVPTEPYRMFTSRAEHRLLLRADNAEDRLTELARGWGLIADAHWRAFERRQEAVAALQRAMAERRGGERLDEWAKKPEATPERLAERLSDEALPEEARAPWTLRRVLAEIKYAGYIARQQRQVEKLAEREHVPLPERFDYRRVDGLRAEARETLEAYRPATLGQASRLAGINPSDVMLLSTALKL